MGDGMKLFDFNGFIVGHDGRRVASDGQILADSVDHAHRLLSGGRMFYITVNPSRFTIAYLKRSYPKALEVLTRRYVGDY